MKLLQLPLGVVVSLAVLCCAAFAAPVAAPSSILPQEFGGWHISTPAEVSRDPSDADPVNAALLKEYGFTDVASATYTSGDGRKLTIKAARFADASGAYGAFTYYKMPQMLNEKIGDQAASLNERVLFYRGSILVDALFSRLSAMSAAELRELANDLPLPSENNRNLPGLPVYLPRESYVKNTAKYVVGPVGLEKIAAPVGAQLVDFSTGAEVVLGNFNTDDGQAALMLISYPTPQIAADRLRRIEAAHQQRAQAPDSAPQVSPGPMFGRRTGPIVVIVAGPVSQGEADKLLNAVNYEANVTWNEPTSPNKRDNIGNLVLNALLLCGILMGFSLVAGLAFGGVRVLIRSMFPERLFDRPGEQEFISLHLGEGGSEPMSRESKYLN
jgi:Family of unknown function (DUF6599)